MAKVELSTDLWKHSLFQQRLAKTNLSLINVRLGSAIPYVNSFSQLGH